MLVGWLTTGKATNFFATRTTRIQENMRPNSGNQNWVCGLKPSPGLIYALLPCWFSHHMGLCFHLGSLLVVLRIYCISGQIVWRRLCELPPPSHHVIRGTCMQLLPLVEMYCKWELEEDCTNLRSLMHRFDSEAALESHALGQSLLSMLHDDDVRFETFPVQVPFAVRPNPFDAVRERLAVAASAIRGLHAQVQPCSPLNHIYDLTQKCFCTFDLAFTYYLSWR